jgi:hypothetical protein
MSACSALRLHGLFAYVLALSISTMNVDERAQWLSAVRHVVSPSLSDRVQEMSNRMAAGDNISVAM